MAWTPYWKRVIPYLVLNVVLVSFTSGLSLLLLPFSCWRTKRQRKELIASFERELQPLVGQIQGQELRDQYVNGPKSLRGVQLSYDHASIAMRGSTAKTAGGLCAYYRWLLAA